MNCIVLRKTCSILPFLQLLGRQKEETEGKEGEGGRMMRAGLSGSTEQDQQFGSPPSLPLCQKRSRGAFRPKWRQCVPPYCHSKHSRSSFQLSSFLIFLPCQKVHSILKGLGYKIQFSPLQMRDGEKEGEKQSVRCYRVTGRGQCAQVKIAN